MANMARMITMSNSIVFTPLVSALVAVHARLKGAHGLRSSPAIGASLDVRFMQLCQAFKLAKPAFVLVGPNSRISRHSKLNKHAWRFNR
jgi:hypothetical protein